MATVHVTIPRMLADLVDGDRRFDVEGATVRGVLDAVVARHPELGVHVFAEDGTLREHVSCFHNERSDRTGQTKVNEGDRVVVLQAVSGG